MEYAELLKIAGIESLKTRRDINFAKFTKKTSENKKYQHWFPKNPSERANRKTTIYKEEIAKGTRLYNSPIFTMRRILNNSQIPETIDLSGLFNTP